MTTSTVAHREAYTLWTRLEAEFQRYHAAISYIPIDHARIQEDLRRYLCLRCAGFLEQLAFECVTRYLESKASGPALEFAHSFFSRAPNLTAETLTKLIGRFGADHAVRFEQFLTKPLRDSLNDLSSIRNTIAHGQLAGGQKLDPARYLVLCKAIYVWLTSELLTPAGTVMTVTAVKVKTAEKA